eukprot:1161825-Pelagomonas_calceolata.AAC.8
MSFATWLVSDSESTPFGMRHVCTATWNPSSSPHCDLCQAEDHIQDEKHVILSCTHPVIPDTYVFMST